MNTATALAWQQLERTDPQRLVDARLQQHWAAQLVAAFADAALERLADDSQSNLGWHPDLGVLIGRQRPDGLAAGLRLHDLGLMVFDESGTVVSKLPLAGKTLDQALMWLRMEAEERGASTRVRLRDYDMPDHAVASGLPFTLEPKAAFEHLSLWFTVGSNALEAVATTDPGWTDIRCWPHHFDLGTLISLEPSRDPSRGRSIGVGMSPGDTSYAEPYFYVNPYGQQLDTTALPKLPSGGGWHTDGWFGAVLVGSALSNGSNPEASLAAFLYEAISLTRRMLEG